MITRQHGDQVWVDNQAWSGALLVPWQGEIRPWGPQSNAELQPEHFAMLVATEAEVVIFGSGARLRFPAPGLTQSLMKARIGFEVMASAAACRTYNVLASENRKVVAVLLPASAS